MTDHIFQGCGIQLDIEGDEHGYIILRDVMGSDADIANSARLSYDGQGASKDRQLLRYLLRHKHTSPFEMAELKFEVQAPIFVFRQWIRHRTANVNEMSARYTELPAEMFVPNHISAQSDTNKQGRREDGPLHRSNVLRNDMDRANKDAYLSYQLLLEEGVARETARGVLPLNIYSKMVWKIDLHNLFHFMKLRSDPHAQKEIRVYSEVLEKIVEELFPISYEAWVDYSKDGYMLSRMERDLVRSMLSYRRRLTTDVDDNTEMSKREIDAFTKEFFNV